MQTKNLLTFVALAALVGAIVSMTTSGALVQAQENDDDQYNGSLIDRIMAQQGSSGNGDKGKEDCAEEEEEEDGADDEDEQGDVDEQDDKECGTEDDEGTQGGADDDSGKSYTASFMAENCTFSSAGTNPFFILEPGYRQTFRGMEDGEEGELIITVLNETRMVDGTETRVVEERESAGGELTEISRNFFAICEETNSVFYFGEEVDEYEDGKVASHGGEWLAGENGAEAGIMMPGTVLLGSRYYQEVAPGVAMDRAEIVGMNETVETPAGTFENVLAILETTPIEPDASETKYHAAGIGLIQDKELKLEKYGFVK